MAAEGVFFVSEIATPLAGQRMERKLLRFAKKCLQHKGVRRGVKEVCKSIRRGAEGLVVFAADVSPVDVISHIPVQCETRGLPYVFVKSRAELGLAAGTARPTSVVLLQAPPADSPLREGYDKLHARLRDSSLSAQLH